LNYYFCILTATALTTEESTEITGLDEKAFEMLFKTYFRDFVFLAQRYVKDLDTAREIAQEAFVSLWEKRGSIDPGGKVKSYLATSVHNRSLNHLRNNRKFDQNLLVLEQLSGIPDAPAGSRSEEEMEAVISACIDELPEKCREIFILNRFENLKYREIADKLGISVKTVEAQMSKAIQHMRSRLPEKLAAFLFAALYSGMIQ
jgi:RNA polymerase sigma-70 factor, ECF subfamily